MAVPREAARTAQSTAQPAASGPTAPPGPVSEPVAPVTLIERESLAKRELGHEFIRYGRLNHVLRTQLADLLPAGLDPAAAQLLAWLVKQGPSRQSELAEHTFLDPSTVSRRISQLVQKGLVERRPDPIDGRAVQLVPTTRGQELFTSIRVRREAILEQVLTGWSHPELTELGSLLRKFNDGFEVYRHRVSSPHPAHAPPGPGLTHVPDAAEIPAAVTDRQLL